MKLWMISRAEVLKIKKKAMRHGIWFKILNRIDQAIINLTIRCVEKIRSRRLNEIVTVILNKLKQNLESPIESLMKQIGLPLAQQVSQIAQRWGNKSAKYWAEDREFVKYLAVIQKNLSSLFKVHNARPAGC